jgi:hypothetical protein
MATPRQGDGQKVYPVEKYGVSLISMGFFLDDQSPVIWRGPVVMGIIRQFLRDVLWGELDFLVVDLPPGTGDASLTLAQEIPLSGGVIVSTPQDVALLDVERGIAMFRQVNVPLLGVIENMSYYLCSHCGEREDIFGHGGAKKTGLEVLGEIPIVEEIRIGGDEGKPLVIHQPDHPVSQVLLSVAQQVMRVPFPKKNSCDCCGTTTSFMTILTVTFADGAPVQVARAIVENDASSRWRILSWSESVRWEIMRSIRTGVMGMILASTPLNICVS